MNERGRHRTFDDPITLPNGRVLKTLGDAGHYVARLPKATQQRPEWQLAAEMLLNAAERGHRDAGGDRDAPRAAGREAGDTAGARLDASLPKEGALPIWQSFKGPGSDLGCRLSHTDAVCECAN
jgi:hypothetical protein